MVLDRLLTDEEIANLIAHCRDFIRRQRIDCPETIYQTDWVIENAYEFIDGVCKIVGFLDGDTGEIR